MNDKLRLLESGEKACSDLLLRYPSCTACLSIYRQIEYLTAPEQGAYSDKSRLKDITIGVLAAREIEPLDENAAEIFHQIASASKLM